MQHSLPQTQNSSSSSARKSAEFDRLINVEEDVDLQVLQKLSWTGIPHEFRAKVWQILLGYLPTRRSRREETLTRKREDYMQALPKYQVSSSGGNNNNNNNSNAASSSLHSEAMSGNNQSIGNSTTTNKASLLEEDQRNLRQILVDIPRTAPDLPLFHCEEVRKSLERILYLWAIRHPASGYVQGMNDLVTPFYACFLADRVSVGDLKTINDIDTSLLGGSLLDTVEADTYWCLTKLLDGIQDHYTSSQPGIQKMVFLLQGIVSRIDSPLNSHFELQGLLYVQFAFRWMNCLLLRELPLSIIVRLWDSYLSEERAGFSSFHVYVCAALLVSFSEDLKKMNLEELIMFLQNLPTKDFTDERAESLLSQAFILQSLFDKSPAHLSSTNPKS